MPFEKPMTVLDKFSSVSFKGQGFDQIRLTAALLVVAHHSWWGVEDALHSFSRGYLHFGLFAVIVFFCISGFLVAPGLVRSGNVIRFGVHRALRIMPALIAVVLASMFLLGPLLTNIPLADYFRSPALYFYAKNILTLTVHHLPGVAWNGQPILINGALWTLNIEVLSYILLAIISIVGALRHRGFALGIYLVAYVIYIVPIFDAGIAGSIPGRLATFLSLFVYFIAGVNIYLFAERIPFSPALAIGAGIIGFAGLGLGYGAIVLPICLPYIVVFIGLSELPSSTRPKHDLSYGVYLIHSPVLIGITLLFGVSTGWLAALITTLITLVLAYLTWVYIEGPFLAQKKAVSLWAEGIAAEAARLSATDRWLPLHWIRPKPRPDDRS